MQNGSSPPWPVPSTTEPLFGLWQPNLSLKHLFYGEGCVRTYLLNTLPSPESKVCIITGRSLAEKTPVIRKLEVLLGMHHAITISNIRQHGPSIDVDAALQTVLQDDLIDTLISVGGGSPIDTAKSIAYRVSEARNGKWLHHIAIPTTLSAAECTPGGGYTKPDGVKVGFMAPEMAVRSIFYDPYFAAYTPTQLWLTTGMRAMDHAVECFYHPYGSEVWKVQSLWAAQTLFEYLPRARDSHPNDRRTTVMLQLAAFMSSGLKGGNLRGGMGLSHSLGHALGSPYGLPHGVTSCLTLGRVVQLKARGSETDAQQIARLLPAVGGGATGNVQADALMVGARILELVGRLGIAPSSLTALGVAQEQIPIITSRACGGVKDGPFYDSVLDLVSTLF
ncbi:hypothetical protein LTR78_005963 [Recurvomyces mirabilis]|uniref:Alcohol dehydrogenase iron-type/glycerol dehydrogenase GldA domain-containing protein n=1 Tax=Recurvomyces mirabilis TaxID=574656 RepID=A0AAE0WLW6_9PEZI|nr:hypothetical protein LTR78_005963 [Recurvomyces mirabilis]KAK5155227.1 hypothetical protein LTS14_006182 [Recurvomyces mirabilis]